ncbi:MAG: Exoglucanase B precursor [Pelotomaculum sp. PtaB.Bin013]|uniref:Fibronectin type III domain-containing protein n=1 Tax=Pelotomaculum isophthalicicum JI TaxID=947010 RepID=A0A9X4H1Q5_9FIRM|nr:fibronectin type III domain-containing protein [Pelotomaculum isophthalicicum]MDF9408361.1 fibronectin type III domain-containing protein [Pelotomaculum isophthalicicum JI]OPX90656.1 MAG: Exoglucanase B precursor [Pelotomaculum sp. PtaB.Bin013]
MRKSKLLAITLCCLIFAVSWVVSVEAAEITAPSNLTAVAVSMSQINLTWTDNSNNESGFKIERAEGSNGYTEIAVVDNVTAFSDTGLAANTTYTYRVRAYNSSGDSDYSNEYSATTTGAVPAAPAYLTATAVSSSRIDLTWNDYSSNESGFKIERKIAGGSYTQIATVGANATSYNDTGLADNTKYYYRVLAYNSSGNSAYSNEVNVATGTVPAAPSDLTATVLSSTIITLTWDDNSSNETGFIIERKKAGGSYTQIATVDANTTTCTISGLAGNTKYYYRVLAYNSSGNSVYSNEVNVTTGTVPAAPSDLTATVLSSTSIMLTWDDNSSNETDFIVERKEAGGSYTRVATIDANTTSYTDYGLTDNTKYYYRVLAYNSYGDSEYSNEESATTYSSVEVLIKLYIGQSTYYVNDQSKTMDTSPLIRENRTVLPIRFIAEAIGASVTWNDSEEKVTISLKDKVIELWIDKNIARINGQYMLIDPANPNVTPIIIPPGRTMLPLRFIAESLGSKVDWDQDKQEVTVTYPAP